MRHTQPLDPHPPRLPRHKAFAVADDLMPVSLCFELRAHQQSDETRTSSASGALALALSIPLLDTGRNDPPNVASSLARVSPEIAIGDLYDLRIEDQRTADASR